MKFIAGHWMIRAVRGGPEVCARVWLCDHEPGEPDNIMDRAHWQGQIGLDLVSPGAILGMVEFCEASPEQQAMLIRPPLSDRVPRSGRAPAFTTAPMAKWKQARARRITAEEYQRELRWIEWAARNKPDHPDLTYRRAIDKRAAPVPRFA